ncbi:MAG: hypothetical protein RBG13Loki_2403 [Promethearchaeota archaeon CR_4]|nr:MAG: hypothetical protein RBG13Loki_2403 [Candidatus Lokiarchaeota archaeon CR_4]
MVNICFSCGKCCLDTEMQLTLDDLTRIEASMGKSWKEFSRWDGNSNVILKNVNHHCIFFSPTDKSCTIYEIRPFGCQLYPVVLNPWSNRCSYDKDCPHPKQISPAKFLDAKCRLIKKQLPHFFFSREPQTNE